MQAILVVYRGRRGFRGGQVAGGWGRWGRYVRHRWLRPACSLLPQAGPLLSMYDWVLDRGSVRGQRGSSDWSGLSLRPFPCLPRASRQRRTVLSTLRCTRTTSCTRRALGLRNRSRPVAVRRHWQSRRKGKRKKKKKKKKAHLYRGRRHVVLPDQFLSVRANRKHALPGRGQPCRWHRMNGRWKGVCFPVVAVLGVRDAERSMSLGSDLPSYLQWFLLDSRRR